MIRLTAAMAAALPIIERLDGAGHEAVFVGGAVRDAVLGIPVKDVDIATSAKPEQVLEMFPRCIPTGLQHGTVTVIHGGTPYEVTTYRKESTYESHRKPSAVSFLTDLDGDLLRRDFTVNAMAVRLDGRVYDPYGGLEDLKRGLLRCVGNANERFQEDALRMVRAVRFIGMYGLRPATSAWRALLAHRELLRHVAMERIQAELDKMLASVQPARCMAWLYASGLLWHTKIPIEAPATAIDLSGLDTIEQLEDRWAFLAIASGVGADKAQQILEALRLSNKRMQTILSIVRVQDELSDGWTNKLEDREQDIRWTSLFLRLGVSASSSWLRIARALGADSEAEDILRERLLRFERLMNESPIYSVKELDLNGAQLATALQREAGPWLKDYLERMLLEVALGRLANTKEALALQAAAWNAEERGSKKNE
ncbi:CCA tRNA nucleotidyltransferase [Paenibacillus sp. LHD-117]|uniref:CCA tRNA nucleotidyltransferase n=1 Tax=Paenibacillus sp. LHD-117 TaxID=3071412 RepID=UPI0027DEC0F6|nr:CCA tRNA nucleotidyltransferase [Paenibacillus sp. LHD-117]MDQ6418198.1 CCA tRNA nucleotidyltransferase [Paenibacillus sp. LHD-117]